MHYLLTHLDSAWALTLIHLRLALIPIVLAVLIDIAILVGGRLMTPWARVRTA